MTVLDVHSWPYDILPDSRPLCVGDLIVADYFDNYTLTIRRRLSLVMRIYATTGEAFVVSDDPNPIACVLLDDGTMGAVVVTKYGLVSP